jgi:hypothetical protein
MCISTKKGGQGRAKHYLGAKCQPSRRLMGYRAPTVKLVELYQASWLYLAVDRNATSQRIRVSHLGRRVLVNCTTYKMHRF